MKKTIICVLVFLLFAHISLAATISGTIYDFDLEQKSDVIITVDTDPVQTLVAKDGTYSLELSLGEYTINARYLEDGAVKESTTEYIKIEKDGKFVLDLILFPDIDQEESLFNDTSEELVGNVLDKGINLVNLVMFLVALIGLTFAVYFVFRYRKDLSEVTKEVEKTSHELKKTQVADESKAVIDFLKENSGRCTQKDIRKHFPSSEAKISLIISELEQKGIVEKIKKGRGNIIVLK